MVTMPLNERKRRILRAVTEDYINSAEPVGSRTIARRYNLGVSPATIRNEMSDLEEEGYLQQPHTSAGRIPSDKGYRFYVDSLMSPQEVSAEDRETVRRLMQARNQQMEEIVHQTARLLAFLTRYTAIVIAPNISYGTVRRVQLIPFDTWNVLVVVVIDPGFVQNRVVETSKPIPPAELARLNEFLNSRLVGSTLADIGPGMLNEIRAEINDDNLYMEAMELLNKGLREIKSEKVFLDGVLHLLNQPEFKDLDKVKVLLNVLDDEASLLRLVSDLISTSGSRVIIGSENPQQELQECSLVTATYELNNQVIGTVGVLGPTRMEYERVVSMVEFIAYSLSELLSESTRH